MRRNELVFQLWERELGIFFERRTYENLRKIQCAINNSETRQEFEKAMPESSHIAVVHETHGGKV